MTNAHALGFDYEFTSVGLENISNITRAQSNGPQLSGFQHTVQTFRPEQHFLSTQIGASDNLHVEPFQPMDVDDKADQGSIYEPMRLVPLSAPPKRFYRTFWRSAAQRILEHGDVQKQKGFCPGRQESKELPYEA